MDRRFQFRQPLFNSRILFLQLFDARSFANCELPTVPLSCAEGKVPDRLLALRAMMAYGAAVVN